MCPTDIICRSHDGLCWPAFNAARAASQPAGLVIYRAGNATHLSEAHPSSKDFHFHAQPLLAHLPIHFVIYRPGRSTGLSSRCCTSCALPPHSYWVPSVFPVLFLPFTYHMGPARPLGGGRNTARKWKVFLPQVEMSRCRENRAGGYGERGLPVDYEALFRGPGCWRGRGLALKVEGLLERRASGRAGSGSAWGRSLAVGRSGASAGHCAWLAKAARCGLCVADRMARLTSLAGHEVPVTPGLASAGDHPCAASRLHV